ncbi:MAG: glucokinase [Burkholderiales bacterium]|jgi:glucokinase|nr:glucokinase [Burkholderiales bacterium]
MILAGDIGGTKTLLALCEVRDGARVSVAFERRFENAAHRGFGEVLAQFLADAARERGAPARAERAGFAVAGPVEGGRCRLTNLDWEIDAAALAARFGLASASVLNDFAATATGIDALAPDDLVTLQAGAPVAGAPRVVLGAGTGLGVAHLFWDGSRYRVVPGEGGHAGFAPASEEHAALWQFIYRAQGRVEIEDVLSGHGLERIHAFLADGGGTSGLALRAPEITAGAVGGDYLGQRAIDLFVAAYGAVAGDLALGVLARGGVYVAGGIAPKILPRLSAGGFLAAFNAKGRFAEAARLMPVHVVTEERLPLIGAALAASLHPPFGG